VLEAQVRKHARSIDEALKAQQLERGINIMNKLPRR
jgi:hypothetical protein